MRADVCRGLEFMGIRLDENKNGIRGQEAILSAPDSRTTVMVVPTDEEFMIASDTQAILKK
jgi:acetate kinase